MLNTGYNSLHKFFAQRKKRRCSASRGSALVELAIVAPLLTWVGIMVADCYFFGNYYYSATNIVRELAVTMSQVSYVNYGFNCTTVNAPAGGALCPANIVADYLTSCKNPAAPGTYFPRSQCNDTVTPNCLQAILQDRYSKLFLSEGLKECGHDLGGHPKGSACLVKLQVPCADKTTCTPAINAGSNVKLSIQLGYRPITPLISRMMSGNGITFTVQATSYAHG